jgi:hypothetical protein
MAKHYQRVDDELIVAISDEVGRAFWSQDEPPEDTGNDDSAWAPIPA